MMKKEFGNIDIIQTANDDFLILEVNSGVMIENYIKINPNEYEISKILNIKYIKINKKWNFKKKRDIER